MDVARRGHPLRPLSAAEIMAVVAVVRAAPAFGDEFLFETIELKEPPHGAVAGFEAGAEGGA